jgi:hypothetical protein
MSSDKYIGLDVYQSTLARLETNGFNKTPMKLINPLLIISLNEILTFFSYQIDFFWLASLMKIEKHKE